MQQSTEILRHQFQHVANKAPEQQKKAVKDMKDFMMHTVQKLERIQKKTDPSHLEVCYFMVGLKIKVMAERIVNNFTLVSGHPKALTKFYKVLSSVSLPSSKLSLSKLKKPLETVEKQHSTLAKKNEEDLEAYCEKIAAPLDTYSSELIRRMNNITRTIMT